jgi:hypothetical protein
LIPDQDVKSAISIVSNEAKDIWEHSRPQADPPEVEYD